MTRQPNNPKEIELVISVDDSHPLNYKSAELLKKYGLVKNAIFFLDTARMEEEQVRYLVKEGFEIGNHTASHRILTEILLKEVSGEVTKAEYLLFPFTNEALRWFCYPRGRYNREVIKVLKDLGYRRARTTRVFQILTPKDPLESHSTVHCYQRKEYGGKDWEVMAKSFWDRVRQGEGNYYHIWWHSWEIERNKEWDKLERVLRYIKEGEDEVSGL